MARMPCTHNGLDGVLIVCDDCGDELYFDHPSRGPLPFMFGMGVETCYPCDMRRQGETIDEEYGPEGPVWPEDGDLQYLPDPSDDLVEDYFKSLERCEVNVDWSQGF